jgi:hypothetical protein
MSKIPSNRANSKGLKSHPFIKDCPAINIISEILFEDLDSVSDSELNQLAKEKESEQSASKKQSVAMDSRCGSNVSPCFTFR